MGLMLSVPIASRRRIVISLKLSDRVTVQDIELDVIHNFSTLTFAIDSRSDIRFGNSQQSSNEITPLSLMWRYRSFYLLSSQPNELLINGLVLVDLESTNRSKLRLDYFTPNSTISRLDRQAGSGNEIVLIRNRWYRFDGRSVELA